jgi:hypothetical protein
MKHKIIKANSKLDIFSIIKLLIIFSILFLGLFWYFFIYRIIQNQNSSPRSIARQQNDVHSNIPTVHPKPTIETTQVGCSDQIPENNALYLGTDKENPENRVLFFSNSSNKRYVINHTEFNSPCVGATYILGKSFQEQNTFFNGLATPKLLKSFEPQDLDFIHSYISNIDTFYVSLVLYDQDSQRTATVYKFTENGAKYEQIWLYDLRSDKYNPFHGAAEITDVLSKYITLSLRPCHGCGGSEEYGTLIVNQDNKNEKYLGFIGNMKIYPEKNIVNYQKVTTYKVKCTESDLPILCDNNNERSDYRPEGDVITETLP